MNHDDYLIVRGKLVMMDLIKKGATPEKGLPAILPRPGPGEREAPSHQNDYVVAVTICIFLMMVATGLRVGVRCWSYRLRIGWDDWFIVLGTVS